MSESQYPVAVSQSVKVKCSQKTFPENKSYHVVVMHAHCKHTKMVHFNPHVGCLSYVLDGILYYEEALTPLMYFSCTRVFVGHQLLKAHFGTFCTYIQQWR